MSTGDGSGWAGQPNLDPMLYANSGPAPVQEHVLVTIGDMSCTGSTVWTPSGSTPVGTANWTVADMSITTQGIPTWAVVCAVIFFVFCLLGLLFLLVKETKTAGSVQVTVQGPRFIHTTQVPVTSPAQVADIQARVSYARSLGAAVR